MKIIRCVSVLLPFAFWTLALFLPSTQIKSSEIGLIKNNTNMTNLLLEDRFEIIQKSINNECFNEVKK